MIRPRQIRENITKIKEYLKIQNNKRRKQLTKNNRHLSQSPKLATQNRNTIKEHIKAKNLLAISFYMPVQQSAAHDNERWLTTPPSQQPNTILNPKAETGIFVSEIHTHRSASGLLAPAKLKGVENIRKETWKMVGDEFTAERFTHSADMAQWKYDFQKRPPRPYSYFS